MLRRVSDEKEPVEFKFSPRSILKGDATVCVSTLYLITPILIFHNSCRL